ncbi:phospholipase/lecithinase/hemolysin [Edaphobacter aggregans]|uniref:Phospholipase/lecithinase/hemolysin n=1 Tax=Edaphobacter aggregans TaxID=570835 RepID=A0A3R9P6T3_9BACT|nr:SGNH/GDSL hydrolase family protein [Edaphobacter aggregans]RSL14757.1 phospholipase/lecithinase/hemolysin [Edaphobacter aggregans]
MSIRRFVCAIAFVLLALQPIQSHATTSAYDAIYVFGDSYCDVGNIFAVTTAVGQPTPPSPPYFHGRFSNGPIWVEHIASSLGLPMVASQLGGTDYAVGGAEVTAPVVTAGGTIPSVPQQVLLYLSQHAGKADPKALYILEGGGNDILNATGGSPQSLGSQIALGIANSELILRLAGAKNFLIPNLFDVSLLPAGRANAAFAQQASIATNKSLNQLLAIEQLLQGIKIRRTDVFSLLQSVASDATHYGFTDIVNPCINPITGTICDDPDHTFFWDVEHPTEFGHAFFAVITEAALSQ